MSPACSASSDSLIVTLSLLGRACRGRYPDVISSAGTHAQRTRSARRGFDPWSKAPDSGRGLRGSVGTHTPGSRRDQHHAAVLAYHCVQRSERVRLSIAPIAVQLQVMFMPVW